ncbi:MAG TPA: LON peptidase substrate-binding domain-containing protein [Pedococcus sp.]|nr:LON peptidase substrate-binding domain-containing protein [Pedococcus sp.]
MPWLPLFPLGTVLVPGAQLPLQIFEPRYIVLLSDLIEGRTDPEFGVVAIRQGHEVGADAVHDLYEVGCAARVSHAVALGQSRFLVMSEGSRRFHLDAIDPSAGTDYLTGAVSWLGEPDGDTAALAELAARLRLELSSYAESLGADAPDWPQDARALSYAVGEAVGLDLGERQSLLSAVSTEARLRMGLQAVRREHALSDRLRVVPQPPERLINLN